jgi:Helicase associated domain
VEKKKYEQGLKTAMTDEKLQHLANLDFEWRAPNARNIGAWDRNVAQLLKFKEQHGHLRVPQKTPTLGPFVNEQRQMYVHHHRGETHRGHNRIHPERLAQLKKIGLFDDIAK